MNADEIVKQLDLKPHPEGGFYRETLRDSVRPDGRSYSTAIYFLLRAGEVSRWHRVDAAEIWHWYAGGTLELSIANGSAIERILLGPHLDKDECPQAVVPAHRWQSARTTGAFTLIGCTVAPGFEFSGFEIAPYGWSPR